MRGNDVVLQRFEKLQGVYWCEGFTFLRKFEGAFAKVNNYLIVDRSHF